MPLFPMFLDLSEGAVLVVGQGSEASRKAEKLRPFCREVLRSAYPPVYGEKPILVFLTEKDHPDNAALAEKFRREGIAVNVADRPGLCDFQFPALITRGDVSIGISTGGSSPALASLLRERLEDALPQDLENLSRKAAELTQMLRRQVPDPKERAALLRQLLEP